VRPHPTPSKARRPRLSLSRRAGRRCGWPTARR
jgi:hypothetical protein